MCLCVRMCAQLPGKVIPEMTYTVSGEMLNLTHSLTHLHIFVTLYCWLINRKKVKQWLY